MQAATRFSFFSILAILVAAMAACTQSNPAAITCPDGWDQVTEYRLYFGRSDATGAPDAVSDEEWSRFLADTVTPRFPHGLTVADGAGQWRNDVRPSPQRTIQGAHNPGLARRNCTQAPG